MKRELVWRRTTNTSNVVIPSAGHLIPQEAPHELGKPWLLSTYHNNLLTYRLQPRSLFYSSCTSTPHCLHYQDSRTSGASHGDLAFIHTRRCTRILSCARGYIHYFSSYVHHMQTGKYRLHIGGKQDQKR